MKKLVVLLSIAMFCVTGSLAFGAAGQKWYLIKGKDGVCKVIQSEKKTPAAIGGPYKTKANAEKGKAKKCPPKKK